MKTRLFLDALVADGVLVTVSRDKLFLTGPEDCVNEALDVLKDIPSLEAEIIRLLNPSDEDRRRWLEAQAKEIHEEHAARIDRLKKAGLPEPEVIALYTTHRDHSSILPERLRPKGVKG